MSLENLFSDTPEMLDADNLFPNTASFPDIPVNTGSPFGDESIFDPNFDNKQKYDRYLNDIFSLMRRNGITEFYYTHLPLYDANVGILFHGEIVNNRLRVSLVPTTLLIKDETFIYEILKEKTGFRITTHSKGNLIIRGKGPDWKLITTQDYFTSLPFDTQSYISRNSSNNHEVKYQELKQIYEEMLAKKAQLALEDKQSKIYELSQVIQKQLENSFYKTVKLCVYIKQVDDKGKVIGENLLKTDYKMKDCEVRLDITIGPGEQLVIKHNVHANFLKEYEGKWEKEAKARGLDIDISQLRKDSNAEFENKETEKNFYQKFIQESKALFNDKIGGYVEAVQSTQKVAKNVWAEGTIYKSNWYSTDTEHKEWPSYMQFEPIVGGVTDGVIDEIVGIKMAITGIYELATDEEKRDSFKKVFTSEGMKQMYEDLKQEAEEIYKDPERSEHFVGQTTVAVGSMFLGGVGLFSKAGKLGEVLDSVSSFIKRITNPKVVKVYEDIRNFFVRKPKEGVPVDEYLRKLDDDSLNALGEELLEESDELARLKVQPQKFIEGKNYENAIKKLIDDGNSGYLNLVAEKAGITLHELKSYVPLHQVQIRMPNTNGGFTTMDNVWVKKMIDPTTGKEYLEAIVNECKLSKEAPFSIRQKEFEVKLESPDQYFDLRNTKFQKDLEINQNIEIRVKTYLKTVGDGGSPPDLTKFSVEKIK